MAIDDNTSYELTGAQVKDLANKIRAKAADNIFVGASSAAPGSKGLVPQPQAGDNTKFLSGDGTWKTAGGGNTTAKVLTSADYNWNHTTQTTTDPDSVALWLLDPGIYSFSNPLEVYLDKYTPASDLDTFIVGKNYGYSIPIIQIRYTMSGNSWIWGRLWCVSPYTQDTTHIGNLGETIDNLTTDSAGAALSARQGKELKELIDSLVMQDAGAPTADTVGTVGMLYEDVTNGKLYICTAIDITDPQNPSYTWVEVGPAEETKFIATDWVGKGPFQEAYETAQSLGISVMYGNQSFNPRGQSVGSTLVLLSGDGSRPVSIGELCSAFNSGKPVVIECAFEQFVTQSPEQCVRGSLLSAYAASPTNEEFTFLFTHPNLGNIVGMFSVQVAGTIIGNDNKGYAVYSVRAQV